MLEILLFALGVMYTPGPVNLLSLNNGMQGRFRSQLPFSLGVAAGLLIWFVGAGYAGAAVVNKQTLPYVGGLGAAFTLYLAWKVMTHEIGSAGQGRGGVLDFKDGLCMQLLNPKAVMVVVPVTTVQFPAAGIAGPWIAVWSAGLALLGFGAPTLYAGLGAVLGERMGARSKGRGLKALNVALGLLLIVVALDMAYEQVLVPCLS